jgi:hypothetical protein
MKEYKIEGNFNKNEYDNAFPVNIEYTKEKDMLSSDMLGDLESINYSKDGYSCVELIDKKVFSIIYTSIGFNVLFTSAIYEYNIEYIASISKEYYKDMIQMLIDFLKLCKFRNETNCLILHYYISLNQRMMIQSTYLKILDLKNLI